MDDGSRLIGERRGRNMLVLPSLTISRVSTQARTLLTALLLIEIGQTYGTSVGVTNQIVTVNSAVAVVGALLMGVLSVRIKHRSLLITGLFLSAITTLGCYSAPSFAFLLMAYSLGGLASTMIIPMTTALMGEHVRFEKRSQALGWLMAGPAALYAVGYPLVNHIGDWRQAYLLFVLPIALIAILLTLVGLPPSESMPRKSDILAGYRGIFSSRSALACLISYGLGLGVWQISLSLAASFYRQQLSMSRGLVAYITIAMAFSYMAGALASRKIIPHLGVGNAVVASSVLLGLSTILRFAVSNQAIAVTLGLLTCLLAGIRVTTSQGLNLEQLPELRGPMMSMTLAFGSMGNVLSLSLGGALLIQHGWMVMGLGIGVFGIIAGAILHLFARDPTRASV